MRAMLITGVLLFILLPPDAQFWLAGFVREAWLSQSGRAFAAGLLGATAGAMIWYAIGWNALARTLHREDYTKADEMYRRRRK